MHGVLEAEEIESKETHVIKFLTVMALEPGFEVILRRFMKNTSNWREMLPLVEIELQLKVFCSMQNIIID
jgi:hypothetical protein